MIYFERQATVKLFCKSAVIAALLLSGCTAWHPKTDVVDISNMPICGGAMVAGTRIPLRSDVSPYWYSVAIDCDRNVKAGTTTTWNISEIINAPPEAKLVGIVILKPRGAQPNLSIDDSTVKILDAKALGADVLTSWGNHPLNANGYMVYRAYKSQKEKKESE